MESEPPRRPQMRASAGEIVGAWLGIWTPRRDTYIPPVPWFRIVLVLVLLVGGVFVTAHLVEEGKRRGAERDRREAAATEARFKALTAREQMPRHARFAEVVPAE